MTQILFGGISFIELPEKEIEISHGVILRKTFAQMFSTTMVAFKPPGKHGFNEGPWKAAKGGSSYQISAEIEVPEIVEFGEKFDQQELIWATVGLIRLHYPYISSPAISNTSFDKILLSELEPTIIPFETVPRVFGPPNKIVPIINVENLTWLKANWKNAIQLMKSNEGFYSAFKAFDAATVDGHVSSSMLLLWGAIEQLFSPNTGELKYRVSGNLAAFLEERGEARLSLFKDISKLYNDRSLAAHTSKRIPQTSAVKTYVILRNAMLKIIENGKVPSQEELEQKIFS